MSIKRLNHAVLYVADAKLSAAFYTEVLGFACRQHGDQASSSEPMAPQRPRPGC
jgi:catechol 2,3-dioxygenase-like lactoylglutathione lyase family enzyme